MKVWAKEFFEAALKHIDLRYILTPYGTVNIKFYRNKGVVGYTYYYIFGIRVACVQKTKPWRSV